MSMISTDRIISETQKFVSIPTPNPPGDEEKLVAYIVDRLENSPIDFSSLTTQSIQGNRKNVVAKVGDPARGRLLLTGHIDTVPADADQWTVDPYEVTLRNGRMIGRGVVDMKSACAAMLLATEDYFKSAAHPGEVTLGFVVDEEFGGSGTQKLVSDGLRVDAAVLGEPTNMKIGIMNKGSVRYTVKLAGISAHSARPDKGVNVIDLIPDIVSLLDELDSAVRDATHELLPPGGSVSVTELNSGIAPNVIPNTAELTVDWRFLPNKDRKPAWFDTKLESILDAACNSNTGISTTFNRWNYKPAFAINADETVVSAIRLASRDIGYPGKITGFTGGTDAGYISEADIPTVIFGPGSIDTQAHSVDESVPIRDVVNAVLVYRQCIERFFDMYLSDNK